MSAFLGMNVLRGLVDIADTPQYWAPDTRVPCIADVMPRDRFVELNANWSLLGVATESKEEEIENDDDKWAKVRPLLDSVLAGCRNGYHPSRHLTVDEQIIAFSGRHDALVHLPNKPHGDGMEERHDC
jgi:hypothetical protein